VVVPLYNLGRYLTTAVNSVIAQTLTDWDMVIVDDCSTDTSRAVADELAATDQRIRVVSPPSNLYLSGALNFGIEQSTGDYILPLDADNALAPRTLEFLAAGLDRSRGVDIAYGAVKFVKEDGTPDRTIGAEGVSSWPPDFAFGQQMMQRNQVPSTSLYRRRVWEQTGGYRRRWRTSEDADFWTRAASLGFVPKRVTRGVTLIYRLRDGQMSSVETMPNYAGWYPWSRDKALVLPAAPAVPPQEINGGKCWHFPSYERPIVSVIIPVGPGHEGLMVDALDSVEAQSLRDWEVVVVNDTRHPLQVHHPWARVVDATKANVHGPGAARNLGVLMSTGQLLVFLDADDYLQPNALHDMVAAWRAGAGVIYGQWWDDKGDGDITLYDPPEFDAGLLVRSGCIHSVTCLVSRQDFLAVEGFDPYLSHWEDWDLQLKFASKGICGTKLSVPLFTYRKFTGQRRDDNMSQFEAGKAAILEKWSQLWEHPEALMAGCSGCPGGGGIKSKVAPGRMAIMNNQAEGLVLIEYTGEKQGIQTYRPPGSAGYRFAASGSNRLSWVYPEHVDWLIGRGSFRRANVPEPAAPVDRLETPMTPMTPMVSLSPLYETISNFPDPEPVTTTLPDAPEPVTTVDYSRLDPQQINYWTPSPLRKIIDDIDPETAALALSTERQGRNRVDIVRLLNARIQRD
jgi:glycosyltransferase involved in cell wall biosynthesis